MSRLLISGTKSGCGKTIVTCAVLSAFKSRGLAVAAFKCGPDYIDPMFHSSVAGIESYNIDPFFQDGNGLRAHIAAHSGQISVLEGAMGYYDGIASTDEASAYTVARETETPVVLAVNAKGAGFSIGAVLDGFTRFRHNSNIRGVIFNNANEARYPDLKRIAESVRLRAYGYIPENIQFSLPSRHLGLLTANEINGLKEMLSALSEQAERSLDLNGLLALAESAPGLKATPAIEQARKAAKNHAVRLAVAKDEAFCFMYRENLELLSALGCETVFFSPLRDKTLPPSVGGLYLCGGYPELHLNALSENMPMRESVLRAVSSGMPTIAECGGFLYLHDSIDNSPMCGVIKGAASETKRLQRFGYITITARRDNLLCSAGQSIKAHEFHYWESDNPGDGFTALKAGRGNVYPCAHATETMYAGFPHMYFPANKKFAERFVERMRQYEG